MNRPEYIVIHHSFTEDGMLLDWTAIRNYHVKVNGWTDIGYHYGVERVKKELTLQIGRPVFMEGAHCKEARMNSRSIGMCVVGNFDAAPPPLDTLTYVRDLCWAFMANYDIPAQNIIGHREAGLAAGFDWKKGQYKTCPGIVFPMRTLQEMLKGGD